MEAQFIDDNGEKEGKISLEELENVLNVLGDSGRKSFMAYLLNGNIPNRKKDVYVQLDLIESSLQSLFGEAAIILMRKIDNKKELH